MSKQKINFKIGFPAFIMITLLVALVLMSQRPGRPYRPKIFSDKYTTEIPAGSFYMGPSDEQVDLSMVNRKKLVSINSFWMDKTEITNEQYRRFVNYVADSLKFLAIYKGGINQSDEDSLRVDWTRASRINMNSRAVLERLNELLLSPDNRIQGRIDLDPNKLIYRYSYVDLKAAAKSSKGLEKSLSDFIVTQNQAVYPDTLVWMRDFSYSYNEPQTRLYFSHPAYNDYPVVGVTWKQSVAFCNWRTNNSNYYLGKRGRSEYKINGIYRLPTEAEWEYTARGGSQSAGYKYSGSNNINEVAWYRDNAEQKSHEVGTKQPNELGIYDMSGNVWEWCQDWYDGKEYAQHAGKVVADPQGPAGQASDRVHRGGGWHFVGWRCRSASRDWSAPGYRNGSLGFRLAAVR